jgi:hypothetical protein
VTNFQLISLGVLTSSPVKNLGIRAVFLVFQAPERPDGILQRHGRLLERIAVERLVIAGLVHHRIGVILASEVDRVP